MLACRQRLPTGISSRQVTCSPGVVRSVSPPDHDPRPDRRLSGACLALGPTANGPFPVPQTRTDLQPGASPSRSFKREEGGPRPHEDLSKIVSGKKPWNSRNEFYTAKNHVKKNYLILKQIEICHKHSDDVRVVRVERVKSLDRTYTITNRIGSTADEKDGCIRRCL